MMNLKSRRNHGCQRLQTAPGIIGPGCGWFVEKEAEWQSHGIVTAVT
jgi:hypothetical protein